MKILAKCQKEKKKYTKLNKKTVCVLSLLSTPSAHHCTEQSTPLGCPCHPTLLHFSAGRAGSSSPLPILLHHVEHLPQTVPSPYKSSWSLGPLWTSPQVSSSGPHCTTHRPAEVISTCPSLEADLKQLEMWPISQCCRDRIKTDLRTTV